MHHFRNTYPTNTNTVSGYLIPDDEDNNTLPLAEINIAALQLTAPTNLSCLCWCLAQHGYKRLHRHLQTIMPSLYIVV